jgi:hypothetical protein
LHLKLRKPKYLEKTEVKKHNHSMIDMNKSSMLISTCLTAFLNISVTKSSTIYAPNKKGTTDDLLCNHKHTGNTYKNLIYIIYIHTKYGYLGNEYVYELNQ